MKSLGVITLFLSIVLFGAFIATNVWADYSYKNNVLSNWSLADKASTITQKSEYVDKFVDALQAQQLNGCYDAMFLKTPDNSYDQNFIALQSLQTRLHDIQGMDPNSFQYQSAIQQITAQEQGQADDMLGVFSNCYQKVHYYWLWNPILGVVWFFGSIALIVLGIFMIAAAD